MKRLPLPIIDDIEILQKLCNNKKLKYSPKILEQYLIMRKQYLCYESNKGNPWLCLIENIPPTLSVALKKYYTKPPLDLSFIQNLRQKGSPDVCPMCGSLKTADLDHFLPQADYPEWAIFSKNLIPACDCNRTRRNDVKGRGTGERVLHPYYDDFLHNRLVSCSFSGNLELPEITLKALRVANVPTASVNFHIKTVLVRTTIVNWLSAKWSNVNRRPSSVIHGIPKKSTINRPKLMDILENILENKDDEHQTPNNWYSILFHGILSDQDLINWIVDRHNSTVLGRIYHSF